MQNSQSKYILGHNYFISTEPNLFKYIPKGSKRPTNFNSSLIVIPIKTFLRDISEEPVFYYFTNYIRIAERGTDVFLSLIKFFLF